MNDGGQILTCHLVLNHGNFPGGYPESGLDVKGLKQRRVVAVSIDWWLKCFSLWKLKTLRSFLQDLPTAVAFYLAVEHQDISFDDPRRNRWCHCNWHLAKSLLFETDNFQLTYSDPNHPSALLRKDLHSFPDSQISDVFHVSWFHDLSFQICLSWQRYCKLSDKCPIEFKEMDNVLKVKRLEEIFNLALSLRYNIIYLQLQCKLVLLYLFWLPCLVSLRVLSSSI